MTKTDNEEESHIIDIESSQEDEDEISFSNEISSEHTLLSNVTSSCISNNRRKLIETYVFWIGNFVIACVCVALLYYLFIMKHQDESLK